MIFQEPMSALNPVMTIGEQISEAIFLHESVGAAARRARVLDMLQLVGIPDADSRYASYPARVFRRDAAARDDRHGAGVQSQAADRRRADHGARRHDPGPGARTDEAAQGALSDIDPADLARSRCHRRRGRSRDRHVLRPRRRNGGNRRSVRPAGSSLHGRPAQLDPQPLDRAGQALPDPGRAARPDRTRARLRLLSPLPEADADLPEQSPPLFQVSETQQAACFALPAARA